MSAFTWRIVTEYSTPEYLDLLTGHTIHVHFPPGVVDDVNYDASVKAFAYLMNNGSDGWT
jgi:hypothetical protein